MAKRKDPFAGDIAAYEQTPSTEEEVQIALHSAPPDLADDTDWLALYEDLTDGAGAPNAE